MCNVLIVNNMKRNFFSHARPELGANIQNKLG